jgi:DNA-binding MarR family transcriptional regulator
VTELASALHNSKQALGQVVTQLVAAGYAEVSPDAADRRAKLVRRTPAGDHVQAAMRAAIGGVEERWRAELGDERFAVLRDALAELTRRPALT